MSLEIKVGADVEGAGKKIEDFAKKSRIALNSLSLVAQDLPYGFIGIQNNLPALISSFGALTSNTKEAGSVFKQLSTALAGPAGAYLAFSVVTGAVTYLTQKYGSLNAAILALSTSNAKLVGIQAQLNKEFASALGNTAGETAKIEILLKTLNDLSKPMKERLDSYTALKKIGPEIARNVDEENGLTRKNIDLINENARARIEYIKIRARETAILNMVNKNEEERIALEQEYPSLLQKKQKAEIAANKIKGLSFDATKTFNAGLQTEVLNLDFATSALEKNAKQRRDLFNSNNNLINQLDPLVQGTSEYEGFLKRGTKSVQDYKYQIDELIGALSFKTQIEDVKELADVILDVNKKYSLRSSALKELQQIGDGVFNGLTLEKKGYNGLKDAIDSYVLKLQVLDLENKGRIKAADLQAQADKNTAKAIEDRIKAEEDLFDTLVKTSMANEKIGNTTDKISKINIDQALQPLKDLAIGAKNVAILMEETFFNPLNEMFTTLFTKFTFSIKSFTQAILASIGQIAAKLATTLVIQGLVSLFSAPLALGGALSPEGGLGFLGKALSGLKLGRGADFNGVRGANMGMSGSVNLVLRGTDLVGSINRTNSQISRVG